MLLIYRLQGVDGLVDRAAPGLESRSTWLVDKWVRRCATVATPPHGKDIKINRCLFVCFFVLLSFSFIHHAEVDCYRRFTGHWKTEQRFWPNVSCSRYCRHNWFTDIRLAFPQYTTWFLIAICIEKSNRSQYRNCWWTSHKNDSNRDSNSSRIHRSLLVVIIFATERPLTVLLTIASVSTYLCVSRPIMSEQENEIP